MVNPFLSGVGSRYAAWPMTGRYGPTGRSTVSRLPQGSLSQIASDQFQFFPNTQYNVGTAYYTSSPVPTPYAQHLTFVAYWTYKEESLYRYDESDWELRVESCPPSTDSYQRSGNTIYEPWEVDASQWQRLSGSLVGMSGNDDYLTTRRTIASSAPRGNDVVKGFELDRYFFDADFETYTFVRCRLDKLNVVAQMEQPATLRIETWANAALWFSDSNPHIPSLLRIPEPTLPTPRRWRDRAQSIRGTDKRGRDAISNRLVEIWSKER